MQAIKGSKQHYDIPSLLASSPSHCSNRVILTEKKGVGIDDMLINTQILRGKFSGSLTSFGRLCEHVRLLISYHHRFRARVC